MARGSSVGSALTDRQFIDFWSSPQEAVTIPAVAADQALPSVVVSGIPSTAVITKVTSFFKFRAVENLNAGANKLKGDQNIQIAVAGPWTNAIGFLDDMFGLAGSAREGGDIFIGAVNLSAIVTADGTFSFQWASACADLASIEFNDVQMGLRVYFK